MTSDARASGAAVAGQAGAAGDPAPARAARDGRADRHASRSPSSAWAAVSRGARDPEAFWRLLRDGVDAITEIPAERWDVDAYYDADPDAAGRMYTRRGGFLDRGRPLRPGVLRHLAARGGAAWIRSSACCSRWPGRRSSTPASARRAWPAAAPACSSASAPATTRTCSPRPVRSTPSIAYVATGTAHSVAAGRLSYVLGLHGPERGRRHRLLLVAGRGPPGVPEPARRRVPPGPGRRRQPDPLARAHRQLLPGAACCRRTAAARRSTPPPTATCAARAAAWSSSSGCATRWPTATASSP